MDTLSDFEKADTTPRAAIALPSIHHRTGKEYPFAPGKSFDEIPMAMLPEAWLSLLREAGQPAKAPSKEIRSQPKKKVAAHCQEEYAEIKEYLRLIPSLSPSGSGFSARCPFHQDSNPSFWVYYNTGASRYQWRCLAVCPGSKVERNDFHGGDLRDLKIKFGILPATGDWSPLTEDEFDSLHSEMRKEYQTLFSVIELYKHSHPLGYEYARGVLAVGIKCCVDPRDNKIYRSST